MTTPLVTYHPCKTIEIWAEKSSGRTLSEEDGLYLASDVDPRLAALVEALQGLRDALIDYLNAETLYNDDPCQHLEDRFDAALERLNNAQCVTKAALAQVVEP